MKARILVIEDNPENRYLIRFLLEKNGFEVETAEDGTAGIARFKAQPPDLVLLDIQLPDMDGYEVARAINTEPGSNLVPLIAVSSFAMPGEKQKAFGAGCRGYIEKPIDPTNFIKQIQTFLPGENK